MNCWKLVHKHFDVFKLCVQLCSTWYGAVKGGHEGCDFTPVSKWHFSEIAIFFFGRPGTIKINVHILNNLDANQLQCFRPKISRAAFPNPLEIPRVTTAEDVWSFILKCASEL